MKSSDKQSRYNYARNFTERDRDLRGHRPHAKQCEAIEIALHAQARISAEVTFAEGRPVITLLGNDKGNYGMGCLARKIVRELGYGESKVE